MNSRADMSNAKSFTPLNPFFTSDSNLGAVVVSSLPSSETVRESPEDALLIFRITALLSAVDVKPPDTFFNR